MSDKQLNWEYWIVILLSALSSLLFVGSLILGYWFVLPDFIKDAIEVTGSARIAEEYLGPVFRKSLDAYRHFGVLLVAANLFALRHIHALRASKARNDEAE